MKIATVIVKICNGEIADKLEELCLNNIPSGFLETYQKGLQYPFKPESVELNKAIQFLDSQKESYRLFRQVAYSKKELENTEYFILGDTYPLELEGTDSLSYGTKYIKGELIGDVLIDRKFFKKAKWAAVLPERIVSNDVKYIIEKNQFSGISFTPNVKDYKGREMSPFHVVHIENMLPEVSETTWLLKHGDTVYLDSDLQYEREKLAGALDFNLTSERLNNDHIHYVIVSSRVKKAFKECGIRLHFEPVTLLD